MNYGYGNKGRAGKISNFDMEAKLAEKMHDMNLGGGFGGLGGLGGLGGTGGDHYQKVEYTYNYSNNGNPPVEKK